MPAENKKQKILILDNFYYWCKFEKVLKLKRVLVDICRRYVKCMLGLKYSMQLLTNER